MKLLLTLLFALLLLIVNAAALHDIVAREPNLIVEWTVLAVTAAGMAGGLLKRLRVRAT
jgi:hypothetical protein